MELNFTSTLADGVAKDLSSGKLKNDSMVKERLLAEMKDNPNIFSIVVAYSPAANTGKLYAPHFKRNGSEIVYAPLIYNYTKDSEQTEWYNGVLKKGSQSMDFTLFRNCRPQLSDRLFGSFLSYTIRK